MSLIKYVSAIDTAFNIIQPLLIIFAAIWGYYRFFREGKNKQRIEFFIDLNDLGVFNNDRVIEIDCIVENKGFIEHKFKEIIVRIRGIKEGTELLEMEDKNDRTYKPRLLFPEKIHSAKIALTKDDQYFVRPSVKQHFSIVLKIPKDIILILVHSKFILV